MKSEKGFTLIEVMITIAIVALIAAAVYNAYFSSLEAWNYNKARLEVQRVQDLTHRWISRYARQADYINPSYSGNKLYIEYIDQTGTRQKIAFGRENTTEDYLYLYNINDNTNRKITDLKFTELSFDYRENLIIVNAEIKNSNDNSNYKFTSFINPRLVEITTP
jgi:prepilin-type N-terminal cleavage/methylation domain-containing protein